MNLPAKLEGLKEIKLPDRELHLAIGMFDGVHIGHQSVIRKAIQGARESGGLAGVLTFWPHPSYLFCPDDPVPQIMTPEIKQEILFSLGIDLVIEQPFTPAFAAIPAADFATHLQRHLPTLRGIYIGENWRFGQGRKGDAAFLAKLGRAAGIRVVAVSRVQAGEEPISSTRIRGCLVRGEVAAANAMLGYLYFCDSTVEEGKKLGRTLGFPTLNLPWSPPLKPRFGVYVVRVARAGESGAEKYAGVANYGLRPSVEPAAREPLLEVFLLGDTCPFSAGDRLRVEWLDFLRPEKHFASSDELKAQIARDIEAARRLG